MSAGRGAQTRAKKTGRKTTAKTTVAQVAQPHGGALNSGGTPGNKGGTGRPPKEFKDWLASLLDDDTVREQAEAILRDKDHRAFPTIYSDTVDRVHGKTTQKLEHSGKIALEDILTASRD